MLIHPEIYAWLNRQNRTEREERRPRPLVAGSAGVAKGGPEKTREVNPYDPDLSELDRDEVEYLNDRKSNLNFYA